MTNQRHTSFLVILPKYGRHTWVREYDGIQKAELNEINMDVTQPLNELQQRRNQLGIPAYMNTLLRGHQQICSKANGSSTVNRSTTHSHYHRRMSFYWPFSGIISIRLQPHQSPHRSLVETVEIILPPR